MTHVYYYVKEELLIYHHSLVNVESSYYMMAQTINPQ